MELKLNPLEQALARLSEAIEFANSDMARNDKRLFQQFRNSVIQCFEFTYELSWRTLKRQLEKDSPTPAAIDELNFNDMIREAAVRGLISDPAAWMDYRKQRNITSHAYNEKMAQDIYEGTLQFYKDAEKLLKALQDRNQ
jgi:nucleotidyltransferase substrate binding protein (TIGR01987 family)